MKRHTIPFLLLCIALIACSALPSSVSAIAQAAADNSGSSCISQVADSDDADSNKADFIDCMKTAAAAALIEANSGKLLLSGNSNSRLPMASTTKTMTALVVIENCCLDETVEVTADAAGTEGSSMYLSCGERLSVRDLLYGLMLLSGNDAAVALAVHVGGTVESFVRIMNDRAAKLGLTNTHFVTPNGLHDAEHYTTAYELALIGAEALKNETFRQIVSTQYYTAETGDRVRTMKNKNALLWDYGNAVGIKTGYTSAAGRCLLFAAERDGMLLVGAVLNCRPMFDVAPEMLNFGFENYSMCKIIEKGTVLARCTVLNGEKSILALAAKEDIIIPVKKGTELSASVHVRLDSDVCAPVHESCELGTAELFCDDLCIGQTSLVASESIAERSFLFYFNYILHLFRR